MLPEAAGRGRHFQARGQSFSLYGPTLSRSITFLSFYSCRKLAHKWVCLRNFAIESAYAPSTIQTIRKKSNERTNEQIRYYTKKDVLKNRFIWNYFYVSAFNSTVIDLYHTAAILSPRGTKSFVFARLASHWMRG